MCDVEEVISDEVRWIVYYDTGLQQSPNAEGTESESLEDSTRRELEVRFKQVAIVREREIVQWHKTVRTS